MAALWSGAQALPPSLLTHCYVSSFTRFPIVWTLLVLEVTCDDLRYAESFSATHRYLKELGVPYERIFVDMNQKEHKADWYTKVCHDDMQCRSVCCWTQGCTGAPVFYIIYCMPKAVSRTCLYVSDPEVIAP